MQVPVDPAQNDLRTYHVARQLHMLPQLRAVFNSNDMTYPMFYGCLDPRAKASAKHILLCLRRWICVRLGVNPVGVHPLLSMITENILSFLSFPEFASSGVLPPRSLYVQFGIQALTAATTAAAAAAAAAASAGEATPSGSVAASGASPDPKALAASTPHATDTPPLRSVSALSPEATPHARLAQPSLEQTPGGGGGPDGSAAQTPLRPPPPPSSTSAVEQLTQVWERSLAYRPMLFVRPAVRVARQPRSGATAPGDTGLHEFFIRMAHTGLLNEESLNPYFGRYGQVSCELLQRAPLTQCSYINEEIAYSLSAMFNCSPQEVYIQDFIVSVDSQHNAERAVMRAYYKELLFIAFHERVEAEWEARRRTPRISGDSPLPALPAANGNNCYAIADVDALMAESAAVYRMLPAAAVAAAASAAANAAAAAAGSTAVGSAADRRRTKREERRRKRRERRERTRRRLSSRDAPSGGVLVSDDDSDSSSTSSSSSSSSSAGAARGALAGYVPHVVVDGFPYWMTEDQLKLLLQNYGAVKALRLSVDDLSGAFTGAVLVLMSSVEEAVSVSDGLHGAVVKGFTLRAGVLNEKLEIESLLDGERRWPTAPGSQGANASANTTNEGFDVMVNERLWV